MVADYAVKQLKEISENSTFSSSPFFMAVGFYRPHLPNNVATTYWARFDSNLVDPENLDHLIQVTDPEFLDGPEPRSSMPPRFAIIPENRKSNDIFMVYHGISPISFTRAMRIGYSAAISQMDSAFQIVLDGLETYGFENSTIVTIIGDNGFNLGESDLWEKQLLTDYSTRVPFIMKVPWLVTTGFSVSSHMVELLDIYRTVADLVDLPVDPRIKGKSLLPIIFATQESLNYNTSILHSDNLTVSVNTSLIDGSSAVSIIDRCNNRQCDDDYVRQIGFSLRNSRWVCDNLP